MTDELASRDALRELLFDDVAPPAGSEAMYAATFAATGSEGADLLPPDGLFDAGQGPDDGTDDLPFDDPTLDDLDDPTVDDPALDDGLDGAGPADLPVDAEHQADRSEATPDPAPEPTVDPGTGW